MDKKLPPMDFASMSSILVPKAGLAADADKRAGEREPLPGFESDAARSEAKAASATPKTDSEPRKSVPMPPNSAPMTAEIKAQLVSEMQARLRPFMRHAAISAEADLDALAALMGELNLSIQRVLILGVLLTAPPALLERIVKSDAMLNGLFAYFAETFSTSNAAGDGCADSPIDNGGTSTAELALLKLMELLSKLPMTIHRLVDFKFGRLAKRLASAGTAGGSKIKERAEHLFEQWSALARAAPEARRREGPPPATAKDDGKASAESRKRRPSPEIVLPPPPAPQDFFELSSVLPPAAIPRSVREAKDEPQLRRHPVVAKEEPVTVKEEPRVDGSSTQQAAPPPQPTKRKKRVSFPESLAELLHVRYIEKIGTASASGEAAHSEQRKEAQFAFEQLRKEMRAEIEWHVPALVPTVNGIECTVVLNARLGEQAPRECGSADAADCAPAVHVLLYDVNAPDPVTQHVPAHAAGGVGGDILDTLLSNPGLIDSLLSKSGGGHGYASSLPAPKRARTAQPDCRHPAPCSTPAGNHVNSAPTIVCKFYKPGKPDSCRWKQNCKFAHV